MKPLPHRAAPVMRPSLSHFSETDRGALTSAQRTRIAKIAERFLGPFANTSKRQHWQEHVTCLVLLAKQRPPRGAFRVANHIRELKGKASCFDAAAKEAKNLSKDLKNEMAKWEVDADVLAVQLDRCAAILSREVASWSAYRTQNVRRSSWTAMQKELLLMFAQSPLNNCGKPHGLTRCGNLANFAVAIWNCAHGTACDVDEFSYAVDQYQKRRREELQRRAEDRRNEGRNAF